MRIHVSLFIISLFAAPLFAAPMSRVVAVIDPQTVAVESNGVITDVRLAGIEVTDARNSLALLSWTVNGAWVLVENGLVYRSPDALLVNRELVAKGFARSTAPETAVTGGTRGVYLGEAAPGKAQRNSTRAAEPPRAPARATPVRRSARRPVRLMPHLIRKQR